MSWPEVRRTIDRPVGRRTVLVGGAAAATGTLAPRPASADTGTARSGRLRYPFQLGVASGDPTPDGAVLWTRLAPSPVDDDGLGGMPNTRSFPVHWQVSTDERMRRVVRRGHVETDPDSAHSVHVEVDGLEPGREYFYRFRCAHHLSPVGRTVTAPSMETAPSSFRLAVASCQAMLDGYFTAYKHLVNDTPDVVFFLGDYIYDHPSIGGRGWIRDQVGPRSLTLANYRQRYASYRCDEDLQEAHRVAPWIVTFDDHDVEDNWAGDIQFPVLDIADYDFLTQRTNAFQAYYEHMPLRRRSKPANGHIQIYRRIQWGQLASIFVLDTRQYRTDRVTRPEDAFDPNLSMTGDEQEAWLLDGMVEADGIWNICLNQTMFVRHDFRRGAPEGRSLDTWDGHVANRDRIIDGWTRRSVRNPLVFTGNQHQHYACDIKADFDDPSSQTVGAEFVGTSIASGRDGRDRPPGTDPSLEENPWIKFHNQQRGYLRGDVSAGEARVDFRVVPYVTRPGAPVHTRATYVAEAGIPGLNSA